MSEAQHDDSLSAYEAQRQANIERACLLPSLKSFSTHPCHALPTPQTMSMCKMGHSMSLIVFDAALECAQVISGYWSP